MSDDVLCPQDETALAGAVRAARRPLTVRGGGTRGFDQAGQILSVAGLSGITLYEPGALTMVAQAGTPLAEINAALAAEGQRLPWEPPDLRVLLGTEGAPTIGAVFATNSSGPRRVNVGASRDFLLGVRFVDGQGEVISNGGRVMKNVTGLDLVKLMAGAHGTLGVLTEVSFKVLPRPAAVGTLALAGLPVDRAVQAMARALGSPFDVTGAALWGDRTLIRVEGTAASVAYRMERLAAVLTPFGAAVAAEVDWAAIRDLRDWRDAPGDVWQLSVKPSDAPGVVARLAAPVVLDWGGGRIAVRVAPGTDLRALIGPFAGHATRIRGTGPGRLQPAAPGIAALTANLRSRFDPRGILNTGAMA